MMQWLQEYYLNPAEGSQVTTLNVFDHLNNVIKNNYGPS